VIRTAFRNRAAERSDAFADTPSWKEGAGGRSISRSDLCPLRAPGGGRGWAARAISPSGTATLTPGPLPLRRRGGRNGVIGLLLRRFESRAPTAPDRKRLRRGSGGAQRPHLSLFPPPAPGGGRGWAARAVSRRSAATLTPRPLPLRGRGGQNFPARAKRRGQLPLPAREGGRGDGRIPHSDFCPPPAQGGGRGWAARAVSPSVVAGPRRTRDTVA